MLVMGRYTEKLNRYRIYLQTDTETDVGISLTEKTEKPDLSVFINSQWRCCAMH